MANHYDNTYEQDEISVFLQQILLRSSSSSSSSAVHCDHNVAHHALAAQKQEPVIMVSHDTAFSHELADEYCDYESEEGLTEASLRKKKQPGCSSKRSRAAEVHNLSEKRRRSRINEKMKALQNLIPNSNKTDKASMLDEAIEYLKQLQLQVQMLTMRNGLSLYPMMLHNHGQISQIEDKNTCNNIINSADHQVSRDARVFGLLHGNRANHVPIPDSSNMIGSKTTSESEVFKFSAESKDQALKIQSLGRNFSIANPKESNYEMGEKISSLAAFESMELSTNLINMPVFSPELNASQIGWVPTRSHEKVKSKGIVKDDLLMY